MKNRKERDGVRLKREKTRFDEATSNAELLKLAFSISLVDSFHPPSRTERSKGHLKSNAAIFGSSYCK